MTSAFARRFGITISSLEPMPPLPQIPRSTIQPLHLSQNNEPTQRFLFDGTATYYPCAAPNSLNTDTSIQQVSPGSGTQISVGTPVPSVGSNGKRKGPPEVQWDASSDRKYARLYSLSDADIDDLPIILRNKKLKFE
jgi:hypothetical protein